MKEFECLTDAVREVKKLVNDDSTFGQYDEVFLIIDHYEENFYVTDDDSDIDEYLTNNFYKNCADWNPEDWSNAHKVYVYKHAINKDEYPYVYKNYKKSCIRAHEPLIRGVNTTEVNYSVDFSIG